MYLGTRRCRNQKEENKGEDYEIKGKYRYCFCWTKTGRGDKI